MSLLLAHHGHWGGGPGPLGWAFVALVSAGLLAGIVALAVWLAGGRSPRVGVGGTPTDAAVPRDDPIATLRMRYARGEIAREEFLQASADLGAPSVDSEAPPPSPPPS